MNVEIAILHAIDESTRRLDNQKVNKQILWECHKFGRDRSCENCGLDMKIAQMDKVGCYE